MEGKQHEGKTLRYSVIHPDDYDPNIDYPMVVLLHGFGADMHDLAGLCPAIDRRGYLYALPNAPTVFQLGPGQTGFGWMPPFGQGTEDDAETAVGLLGGFFDEVRDQEGVSEGKVLLMGFSQGGGMTYRCGLPSPETFAGLGALSSVMPDPSVLRQRLPTQRTQPIFIAHGTHDPLIPIERAREAKSFLEAEGYSPLYQEFPMRHEISQEVLQELTPWIKQVLPPATA